MTANSCTFAKSFVLSSKNSLGGVDVVVVFVGVVVE